MITAKRPRTDGDSNMTSSEVELTVAFNKILSALPDSSSSSPTLVARTVLQHQLYTIIKNRTIVDETVMQLRRSGEIRCINFPGSLPKCNPVLLMLTPDYEDLIRSGHGDRKSISSTALEKFIMWARHWGDMSVFKEELLEGKTVVTATDKGTTSCPALSEQELREVLDSG
eukprot:gene24368-45101_t